MSNELKQYVNKNSKYNKIDIDNIKNTLNQYDIVSFDIFDTLVKRNLNKPTDLLIFMEKLIKKEKGLNLINFSQKRIAAEKKARELTKRKEVNLNEIYSCFNDKLVEENLDYLQKLEESMEVDFCTANKDMQEVYSWCLKNNKKIVLISDMYLPLEVIEKILKNCGYEGYEKIYLSCQYDARKSTGELYKIVKSDFNTGMNSICHIGDNYKSDGRMAEKEGFKSIVIPLNIHRTNFFDITKVDSKENFEYAQLYKFCNNNLDGKWGLYKKFGYEAFGSLLYGFSQWVLQELKDRNINKVYFFARDGLIMKKAFDCIYKDESIECYYLEVSRRSLRVPQLWLNPEYESIIKSFSAATMNNIRGFFDTLGLNIDNYVSLCNELNIPLEYKFKRKDMLNDKLLINLYSRIKDDIINNSKQEYEMLIRYLNQNNFNGKVAIVDIGWRGSMQKFLINVLESINISADIKGYYIGLAAGAREYSEEMEINFKGYAFDCNKNPNEKDIRQPFVGLIETLFLAQTGSCKYYYYDEEEQKVKVTYYDNEYYDSNGELTESAKNVVEIQEGALQFINDFINSKMDKYFNISSEIAIKNLIRVGTNPNMKELMMFADMEFLDGEVEKLAAPEPMLKYIKNPKNLINDFYKSRWKIGFMKRMFKLPLPYKKIYEIMKKV